MQEASEGGREGREGRGGRREEGGGREEGGREHSPTMPPLGVWASLHSAQARPLRWCSMSTIRISCGVSASVCSVGQLANELTEGRVHITNRHTLL